MPSLRLIILCLFAVTFLYRQQLFQLVSYVVGGIASVSEEEKPLSLKAIVASVTTSQDAFVTILER